MNDFPRATVDGPGATGAHYCDDQVKIASHVVAVPGCGDVLFHHADAASVAEVSANDGPMRISLMLAIPACDCGCGARGRGLFLTPGVEDAKAIAEQLLAMVDKLEREALKQTDDVLKALRK